MLWTMAKQEMRFETTCLQQKAPKEKGERISTRSPKELKPRMGCLDAEAKQLPVHNRPLLRLIRGIKSGEHGSSGNVDFYVKCSGVNTAEEVSFSLLDNRAGVSTTDRSPLAMK